IIEAMDTYDRMGLYPACAVFHDSAAYAVRARTRVNGMSFDDASGILEIFVRGLSGRPLKLEPGEEVYTDTSTLFLPSGLALFPNKDKNFRLYKAIAAHLWAQTWYGTFRSDLSGLFASFPDQDKAKRLFHALETIRLDARLAADLPGLHRDMQRLREELDETTYPDTWQAHLRVLRAPDASVQSTIDALNVLYYDDILPPPLCYQGTLQTERAEQVMAQHLAREKDQFHAALARLLDEKGQRKERAGLESESKSVSERLRMERTPDPDQSGKWRYELTIDGQPVAPPPDVKAMMDSIAQDLGDIPDDYLVAAGDGGYRRDSEEKNPDDVWKGTYHEEGAFLYNEWDYRRQHYRKHWCVLREIDVHPLDDDFVSRTRHKYAAPIASLRKSFEALRGEERLFKRQKNGDNIDFDALVEAYADMHHGMEMSERVLTKLHKQERNIAVMFMVDMSGSTKGWINDAEREALVLLCEALEVLGDRYAIYGFSGITRKRCELYRVKRFDEPYSDQVRARIAGIKPEDYTRMGVAIRHLTRLLNEIEARTKLLITLSDGKPDDYDGYRGDYGIEDTRQALIEAKRDGIHPFCITIDTEARDYLPHMYGSVNWTLIDDVRRLPLKVSEIYRRLTT
ncbi:MAG: nitric oxide reductase activation protein NorD, partial [Acidiferrobacterales bacterium]